MFLTIFALHDDFAFNDGCHAKSVSRHHGNTPSVPTAAMQGWSQLLHGLALLCCLAHLAEWTGGAPVALGTRGRPSSSRKSRNTGECRACAQLEKLKAGVIKKVTCGHATTCQMVEDRRHASWHQWYAQLLLYKQRHGDCTVPIEPSPSLGAWVNRMRVSYQGWDGEEMHLEKNGRHEDDEQELETEESSPPRKRKRTQRGGTNKGGGRGLSTEMFLFRLRLLRAAGFTFDGHQAEWDKALHNYVSLKDRFGSRFVQAAQGLLRDSSALKWLAKQRAACASLHMTAPRLQKMLRHGLLYDLLVFPRSVPLSQARFLADAQNHRETTPGARVNVGGGIHLPPLAAHTPYAFQSIESPKMLKGGPDLWDLAIILLRGEMETCNKGKVTVQGSSGQFRPALELGNTSFASTPSKARLEMRLAALDALASSINHAKHMVRQASVECRNVSVCLGFEGWNGRETKEEEGAPETLRWQRASQHLHARNESCDAPGALDSIRLRNKSADAPTPEETGLLREELAGLAAAVDGVSSRLVALCNDRHQLQVDTAIMARRMPPRSLVAAMPPGEGCWGGASQGMWEQEQASRAHTYQVHHSRLLSWMPTARNKALTSVRMQAAEARGRAAGTFRVRGPRCGGCR